MREVQQVFGLYSFIVDVRQHCCLELIAFVIYIKTIEVKQFLVIIYIKN